MSSTNSFQENSSAVYSFSSNQSSTFFEDQDSSMFGSAKIFTTDITVNSSYGNTFIHIGFLVLLLLIVFLVIRQCRAAFKQRSQGYTGLDNNYEQLYNIFLLLLQTEGCCRIPPAASQARQVGGILGENRFVFGINNLLFAS